MPLLIEEFEKSMGEVREDYQGLLSDPRGVFVDEISQFAESSGVGERIKDLREKDIPTLGELRKGVRDKVEGSTSNLQKSLLGALRGQSTGLQDQVTGLIKHEIQSAKDLTDLSCAKNALMRDAYRRVENNRILGEIMDLVSAANNPSQHLNALLSQFPVPGISSLFGSISGRVGGAIPVDLEGLRQQVYDSLRRYSPSSKLPPCDKIKLPFPES